MPAKELRLTFDGGIAEHEQPSQIPNGFLTECKNWEPRATGGLRVRGSWTKGSVTGLPATRKCKGIGLFQRYTTPTVAQVSETVNGLYDTTTDTITLSWPAPTTKGNTLVFWAAFDEPADNTSTGEGPVGYRNVKVTTGGGAGVEVAIRENAPSESGDVTVGIVTTAGTNFYAAGLIELANVSPFSFENSEVEAATGTSITETVVSTAPSTIVLGIVGGSTATSQSYSSTSAGWSRIVSRPTVPGVQTAAAVFSKTNSAPASNALTVNSAVSGNHALALLSFRGWYGPATIRQYAQGGGTATGATSISAAWSAPTTAGNLLVLAICASGVTTSTDAVSGTGSWTNITSAAQVTGAHAFTTLYYIENAASQSGTQSFTLTTAAGSSNWTVFLIEIAGALASGSLDKFATAANANSLSVAPATAATTQAYEISISSFSTWMDTSFLSRAGAPFSAVAERSISGADMERHIFALSTSGATGTQTATWTDASTTCQKAAVVATFKTVRNTSIPERFQDWLVAHDDTTEYEIWGVPQSDLAAGTFTTRDSVTVSSTAAPVSFSQGLGATWYTAPQFTAIRRYDGDFAISVDGSPVGARCLAGHLQRLWAGGTTNQPSRLYFSEIGDGRTWPEENAIDVGEDDGEAIEDLLPFVDVMLVAKRNSLWAVTGTTLADLAVTRIQGGGAAPGRSLVATPYGAFIAGREAVWLWDGGSSVQLVSRGIESTYGFTGNFMQTSYIDDQVYICDEGSGKVWVFQVPPDGTWRTEETDGAAVLYNYGERQVFGPKSSTTSSLLNFRDFPAPTRGKDFDTLTEMFRMRTPDYSLAGPNRDFTLRHLSLKLRQLGGTAAQTGLTFTPYYNGVDAETKRIPPRATAGVFWHHIPLGKTHRSFGFALDQTMASTEAAAFEIEEALIEYEPTEPRTGR
jgi:hypothetical protein